MKKILKTFIIVAISLKITELLLGNIHFKHGIKTLLITAGAWCIFEYLLKPIAKILLLPINLITLGTLRWVINVLGLFIATTIIDGFYLTTYTFPGFNSNGVTLPTKSFGIIVSYIIVSLVLNLTTSILSQILK